MSMLDEDVRIITGFDGRLLMGALSNAGIVTLTDLMRLPEFVKWEQDGKLKVRRLFDGAVYIIVLQAGLVEAEYGESSAEVN